MQVDDVVVFARPHYEILRSYSVVREHDYRRLERLGRVTDVGEGWVRVMWAGESGRMRCHFPDNLEVLRRRQ